MTLKLIDALETRVDTISFLEPTKLRFDLDLFEPVLEADGQAYSLDLDALTDLLNMLKIPTKFWQRCAEHIDSTQLAVDLVNHWLKQYEPLRLILQADTVTQLMSANKPYLSPATVNDIVINALTDPEVISKGIFDGIYHAFYIGSESFNDFRIGIRVLFSDTFNVTPRFDAILYSDEGILAWNLAHKKFNTNGLTTGLLQMQVEEFIALSLEQLHEQVCPWLESEDWLMPTDATDFIYRLAAELRITRADRTALINHVAALPHNASFKALVLKLSTAPLHIETARLVQVACSHYLVTRNFK